MRKLKAMNNTLHNTPGLMFLFDILQTRNERWQGLAHTKSGAVQAIDSVLQWKRFVLQKKLIQNMLMRQVNIAIKRKRQKKLFFNINRIFLVHLGGTSSKFC